jgi:hypothetical protein
MDALPRLATVSGSALAGVTRAVAAVRTSAKPLHPRGHVVRGTLRRTGGGRPSRLTGVTWLDEPGVDDVLVRRSRAVGWPSLLPDVHGLAMRVDLGSGHGDLLFATTGLGRLTRFLLAPGWDATRPMTTLLPYRSPSGALVLAIRPCGEGRYELAHASAAGVWYRFAELELSTTSGPDPLVSFDPVLHQLPGLAPYSWVERLREPAYLTARRTRSGR